MSQQRKSPPFRQMNLGQQALIVAVYAIVAIATLALFATVVKWAWRVIAFGWGQP